jgi:hypothetical protein
MSSVAFCGFAVLYSVRSACVLSVSPFRICIHLHLHLLLDSNACASRIPLSAVPKCPCHQSRQCELEDVDSASPGRRIKTSSTQTSAPANALRRKTTRTRSWDSFISQRTAVRAGNSPPFCGIHARTSRRLGRIFGFFLAGAASVLLCCDVSHSRKAGRLSSIFKKTSARRSMRPGTGLM